MINISNIKETFNILCLGAHADDIEIGCGGTILRMLEEFNNVNINWVVFSALNERKKEALEVLKAELDRKYRPQLEKEIGKKPTEAVVSAAIVIDDIYRLAQNELINANEDVNILASAKSAFEAKKKALEGLTHLWLGGYFSNPNIPVENNEDIIIYINYVLFFLFLYYYLIYDRIRQTQFN